MTKDPGNVTQWKHKFGFHNRGLQWDTPMSMKGKTGYSLWHKDHRARKRKRHRKEGVQRR